MNIFDGSIERWIKAEAIRLGFSFCGITSADQPKHFIKYKQWIDLGNHAGMNFLESSRHIDCRENPKTLMPGVRSILSLAVNYPLWSLNHLDFKNTALLAGYVGSQDYHLWIPQRLNKLLKSLEKQLAQPIPSMVFTDSGPILEREIACRAGFGWIGKNSCVISPVLGSSVLLAEVFLEIPLSFDSPFEKDYCGKCTKCIDACPTHCILPDRTINAHNCISYQTIENKGEIPEELRLYFGNWLFGCDICQMVCPWNQKNTTGNLQNQLVSFSDSDLELLLRLSSTNFSKQFGQTAISRAKLKGLSRNILIYMGNSKNPAFIQPIKDYLASGSDPIHTDTANWALTQLFS